MDAPQVPVHRLTPARRELAVLGALAVALFAVYAGEGLAARGVYNDDDIGHYLVARDAPWRPALFLDVWGRPLFTLVYALPAQFGFAAVRLTTAVIMALGVFATGLAGARIGIPAPIAGGLFGTMPFVLLLSYSSLTEPLCALVVAAALWAWLAGRPALALVLTGLVPLARLELSIVAGLCGLAWILGTSGSRRLLGLLTGTGVLAWALAGAIAYGEPLWLASQVFTGGENLYGQTGFWHYIRGLIFIIGPIAFLFLLVDLIESIARRRLDLLTVLPGLVLFLYVLFSWKLSIGHAAGFLRHMVAPAPLFALAAGRGMTAALGGGGSSRRALSMLAAGTVLIGVFLSRALIMHHRAEGPFELARITVAVAALALLAWAGKGGRRVRAPAAGRKQSGARRLARAPVAAALFVAIAFVYAVTAEPPLRPDPEQEAVLALWNWFAASEWVEAPVIASHPWFLRELAAVGRLPRGGVPLTKRSAIEAAPAGSVIIWDSHYSIRPPEELQLRDFKFDPRFRLLRESIATNRRFSAYALLKAASGETGSEVPQYDPQHGEPDGRQSGAGER